jgi:aminomuconate-semialdehyde/2-hydroxymuconate-6-semialdehyde dehydrogenase
MLNWEACKEIQNFIGGKYENATNGTYINNINPATNTAIGTLPNSNEEDVNKAVLAAKAVQLSWANTPAEQRFKILNKIADLIDENLEELALAECMDNGKPLTLCKRVDIPRASANFRFFATGAMHFASESHGMENVGINYTLRQPVGIVGCISPWNLPLYLFTWKIAPALAAGNCVIAKPSEVTPLTAHMITYLCSKAGLPDGVLNILYGDGPSCGAAIVAHPDIKAISFTGSTRAGAEIARVAGPMFKKISLELGGKNPTLIFADCDWRKMIKTVVQSSFANQGQICLCGSRLLIESSIYEQFKTAFVETVKKLTVGHPLLETTKQGAVVSKLHYEKILNCIATAQQEGGKILTGGHAVELEGEATTGFYIAPTVIENLGPHCTTNMEEIFGPVVTLQPFVTMDDAIQLANTSNYGLAASVWTQDITKATALGHQLNCGIVWINTWLHRDLRTPFGGMQHSGVGREGGWDAFKFFTEPKNICIVY